MSPHINAAKAYADLRQSTLSILESVFAHNACNSVPSSGPARSLGAMDVCIRADHTGDRRLFALSHLFFGLRALSRAVASPFFVLVLMGVLGGHTGASVDSLLRHGLGLFARGRFQMLLQSQIFLRLGEYGCRRLIRADVRDRCDSHAAEYQCEYESFHHASSVMTQLRNHDGVFGWDAL